MLFLVKSAASTTCPQPEGTASSLIYNTLPFLNPGGGTEQQHHHLYINTRRLSLFHIPSTFAPANTHANVFVFLWCFYTRARQRQDKCSYDAFHTRHVGPGVKGIIGMHRFNICLVVVLSLSCSGVKTPLPSGISKECRHIVSANCDFEGNYLLISYNVYGPFGEQLGRPKIAHRSHNDVRHLCWHAGKIVLQKPPSGKPEGLGLLGEEGCTFPLPLWSILGRERAYMEERGLPSSFLQGEGGCKSHPHFKIAFFAYAYVYSPRDIHGGGGQLVVINKLGMVLTAWFTEWFTMKYSLPISNQDLWITKSLGFSGFGAFTETTQNILCHYQAEPQLAIYFFYKNLIPQGFR